MLDVCNCNHIPMDILVTLLIEYVFGYRMACGRGYSDDVLIANKLYFCNENVILERFGRLEQSPCKVLPYYCS